MTQTRPEDPAGTARWEAEKAAGRVGSLADEMAWMSPGWLRRTGEHPTAHSCDFPSMHGTEPGDVWRCPSGHLWVVDGGGTEVSGIWRSWHRAPWTTRLRYSQWGMWLTMVSTFVVMAAGLTYASVKRGVRW